MKNGFKVFLMYLIIPSLLGLIFYDLVRNNLIIANTLFYLVLLGYFLFLSRKDLKEDLKDFKSNLKKQLITIIKWVLIGFILMLLSNYIIQLFIKELPTNEVNNRIMLKDNPVFYLIYLVIVAPLLEEYVFRFSFKGVKNYYLFTILTSFLFASLHLLSITNLEQLWFIIPYFLLSFGFANIYFKTKNYWAVALGHIIHNVMCVIIILLY